MKRQDHLKMDHQPSLHIIIFALLSFISGTINAGDRIAGRDFATRSEVMAPQAHIHSPRKLHSM